MFIRIEINLCRLEKVNDWKFIYTKIIEGDFIDIYKLEERLKSDGCIVNIVRMPCGKEKEWIYIYVYEVKGIYSYFYRLGYNIMNENICNTVCEYVNLEGDLNCEG